MLSSEIKCNTILTKSFESSYNQFKTNSNEWLTFENKNISNMYISILKIHFKSNFIAVDSALKSYWLCFNVQDGQCIYFHTIHSTKRLDYGQKICGLERDLNYIIANVIS